MKSPSTVTTASTSMIPATETDPCSQSPLTRASASATTTTRFTLPVSTPCARSFKPAMFPPASPLTNATPSRSPRPRSMQPSPRTPTTHISQRSSPPRPALPATLPSACPTAPASPTSTGATPPWSMRWSDGAVDARPGSGQQGITDAHLLAPQPAAGDSARTADVTAVATLHLTGDAVDFDDAGAPTVVHRAADVQISNHRTSTGLLQGAVYTPPQLAVAAVPVGQKGDGTIPPPDPRQPPLAHADTIRGRLLELFPRALVLRPGTETVGGTTVGEASSEVISWTYLGGPTDAPSREATVPDATALPDRPVAIQWNHAERLDAQRRPVDEEVPLRLLIRTTYPDGHAEDQTITGSIAVSIYYVGLMDEG